MISANTKGVEMPEFPKVVKAVVFFEFSGATDSRQAMADVDRFIASYTGSGATIYDRVDVIDRNGKPNLWREGLPWEPPVNVVLNLAGASDAPDWEVAENGPGLARSASADLKRRRKRKGRVPGHMQIGN